MFQTSISPTFINKFCITWFSYFFWNFRLLEYFEIFVAFFEMFIFPKTIDELIRVYKFAKYSDILSTSNLGAKQSGGGDRDYYVFGVGCCTMSCTYLFFIFKLNFSHAVPSTKSGELALCDHTLPWLRQFMKDLESK